MRLELTPGRVRTVCTTVVLETHLVLIVRLELTPVRVLNAFPLPLGYISIGTTPETRTPTEQALDLLPLPFGVQ